MPRLVFAQGRILPSFLTVNLYVIPAEGSILLPMGVPWGAAYKFHRICKTTVILMWFWIQLLNCGCEFHIILFYRVFIKIADCTVYNALNLVWKKQLFPNQLHDHVLSRELLASRMFLDSRRI